MNHWKLWDFHLSHPFKDISHPLPLRQINNILVQANGAKLRVEITKKMSFEVFHSWSIP